MPQQDFDLADLAAYLHLTPQQVEKLASRDKIPGRKVSGRWRFSQADVHHWLEDRIGVSNTDELERVEGNLDRHTKQESVSIKDMLAVDLIRIPLSGRSPKKIVTEICNVAADTGRLWDVNKMVDAVLSRESMHSTALDNGVALLHPRRPLPSILSEGFLALGRSHSGIPFGGSRGILTDIFFLICSFDDRTHLRTLARLSRVISDPEITRAIRESQDADEIYQLIVDKEEEL
ncbi:MAG: PTS fructose transporter subunit IIA [Blastopirellula sp.]|nr:MAG: PTS fructose transporter subunit IIA [Blastopirellula sp.]